MLAPCSVPPVGAMPSPADVIRDIHAASLDTDCWPAAVEGVRARLDAATAMLVGHAFDSGEDRLLVQCPPDPGFAEALQAFAARNPWYLSSAAYVPGRVIGGDELLQTQDLQRTDFYRQILQPRGLLHRLCGVVVQRGQTVYVLIAYRDAARGDFAPPERAELAQTLPHLAMTLECQWRWQEADDLAQSMLTLTERESNPLFLVDAQGTPVHHNRAAQRLLAHGEGLFLDGERLSARSAGDRRVLREAIAQVAQAAQGAQGAQATQGAQRAGEAPEAVAAGDPAATRVVTLATPEGGLPLVVVVRAAGQVFSRASGTRRGLAVVTVRGSHSSHDPAHCAFAQQYELTVAQARVSTLVFAGQSLGGIARTLNVSENTVRSHLKQVFLKTDTHGQMDLVHLHARVCTTLS